MGRNIGRLLCLLSCAALSLACDCKWFEREAQLQQLYDRSEEVFVGRAIEAIEPLAQGKSRRLLGHDVLLQVTNRKKGRIRRDTVLVLQDESNCARNFIQGDTLYVFASSVRHVQGLPRLGQEPYSHFDEQRQTFFRSGGATLLKRYQKWARRFPAVTTNQCVSFTKDHPVVSAFFLAKADQ